MLLSTCQNVITSTICNCHDFTTVILYNTLLKSARWQPRERMRLTKVETVDHTLKSPWRQGTNWNKSKKLCKTEQTLNHTGPHKQHTQSYNEFPKSGAPFFFFFFLQMCKQPVHGLFTISDYHCQHTACVLELQTVRKHLQFDHPGLPFFSVNITHYQGNLVLMILKKVWFLFKIILWPYNLIENKVPPGK